VKSLPLPWIPAAAPWAVGQVLAMDCCEAGLSRRSSRAGGPREGCVRTVATGRGVFMGRRQRWAQARRHSAQAEGMSPYPDRIWSPLRQVGQLPALRFGLSASLLSMAIGGRTLCLLFDGLAKLRLDPRSRRPSR
jgi:hypothetical protein